MFDWLCGWHRLTFSGADCELLLNRCVQAGLPIRAVQREEAFVLSFAVSNRARPEVLALAARCGCELCKDLPRGLPARLKPFRRRYAVILGATLCIVAILSLSRVILVIDIEGNETVSEAEILSVLRQNGVHPGIYGPALDRRSLSHKVLLAMQELSFFSLNLKGTRAQVIVRERSEPPAIFDEKLCSDIVAKATGIITRVEHMEGELLCAVGDTVLAGELLIGGVLDIKEAEYSDADLGVSYHHAQGRIYARTWRTLVAKMPLTSELKCPTGEEKTRFSLNFMGKRVKFYGNGGISFPKYDKISTSKTWMLADGAALPFALTRERYRAYETQTAQLDQAATESLLQERLLESLKARVGEDAELLRLDYVTRLLGEELEVTLLAECSEEIGKTVPLTHLHPEEETQ